jgi:hypothetical protein
MPEQLASRAFEVDDDLEAVYQLMEERRWTDGLPVIPPTEARIRAMLQGTDRGPAEVIARIPPLNAPATVEKIAINAVMAGCRPEYLPVVLAAVEAVAAPEFNLLGHNTSTTSSTPLLVVNGPSRDALDLNYRESCFGPSTRANATVGRAVRLVIANVGGVVARQTSKSVFGYPGRYTMCVAEWEERNPWEPLSVQMGLPRGQDAVTAQSCHTLQDIVELHCKSAECLLTVWAHSIDHIGQNQFVGHTPDNLSLGQVLIIFCPDFADTIARDGWSLADVREFLYQNTQPPVERWPRELRALLEEGGRIVDGRVPLVAAPEQFLIMVAGGAGGYHGMAAHGFGATLAQCRPFRLGGG